MAGTLTRWEPFSDLGELRGSIFDKVFGDWLEARGHSHLPEIDVMRENGNLVVRADLPGIKPDEVKIEIADDVLTLSGGHEETSEDKGKDYVRRERRQSFYRSLVLPAGVVAADVKATTHDGVVEVTVPLPKKAKSETITITPTSV